MKTLCQPENGVCSQCGKLVTLNQFRTCSAKRRTPDEVAKNPVRLGDKLADFFESLGITKDRYKAAKAAIGFKATCGCDARRQWLNDLGESLGINGAAAKLAAWTSS